MYLNLEQMKKISIERRSEYEGVNVDGTNIISEFMIDFTRYINSTKYIGKFDPSKTYYDFKYTLSDKFDFNKDRGTSFYDVFRILRSISSQPADFNILTRTGIAKFYGFDYIKIKTATIINKSWIDVVVDFKLAESK